PCVTFNNHDSSTKSYSYGKEHEVALHELNFVPSYEEIEIDDYDDEVEVQMHDGSWIVLKQLDQSYDPTNKMAAYETLVKARSEGKLLTGLFYVDESQPDMNEMLNTVETPLSYLPAAKLRPSKESLTELLASF
ncbi:MAG: 2-oxoacid:ferredoxin oxidoreductase subunit beta, partial [Caldilineaceae bacterium]|nr:2-oxoacid:ferredoxin oxidoreductase subunit beta [Caldilineaceae bacterium]